MPRDYSPRAALKAQNAWYRLRPCIDRPLESALVALNRWLPVGAAIRTLPGVHGLLATAIAATPGAPQLILDNERAKRQTVVLRGARAVQVELLRATRRGGPAGPRRRSPNPYNPGFGRGPSSAE